MEYRNDKVQDNIPDVAVQACHSTHSSQLVANHLKKNFEALVFDLFSHEKDLKIRWIKAYFPFTSPSWEMEILYQGKWLEIMGCGVMRQEILDRNGHDDKIGWAFGLGLERIAMVLFSIPDIRLFWSKDPRFLSQFSDGKIKKFVPFSKYPACYKVRFNVCIHGAKKLFFIKKRIFHFGVEQRQTLKIHRRSICYTTTNFAI